MKWDLQSKLYDEEKYVDMLDQLDNPVYFNNEVQRVIKEGNTSFSSICMEYAKKNKFNH